MSLVTLDSTAITLDAITVTLDSAPVPPPATALSLPCPTDAEIAARLALLRPRGDAWRNGDVDALHGSVMGRFFDALGVGFGPTERRFCALVAEFFCSSAVETRDVWAVEYGLPDACDPFAGVCEKVNAVGDTTAAYAVSVAAARGWSIAIAEEWITYVEDCTAGLGLAGTMICGAETGVKWIVSVNLPASTSYVAAEGIEPLVGLMLAGDGLDCPPDIAPLTCLIRRIAPAHADLEFLTLS